MSSCVIQHIIDQHADDAAFLWLQRDAAVGSNGHGSRELSRLDERLEAHVDGLRVAGELGWVAAQSNFDRYREPGETFVAALLALESQSENRIGYIVNVAESSPGSLRAVISALGWAETSRIGGIVESMLRSRSPQRRFLGVAACSVRRFDPSDRLKIFFDDVPYVRARALRLAGELGRADLLDCIRGFLADADEPTQFWAAWTCVLMGDREEALAILRSKAGSDAMGFKAFQLSLLAMHHADAVAWLGELRQRDLPLAIAGAGIVGDPVSVPWLLKSIPEPRMGRLAGESFELITGVGIESHGIAQACSVSGVEEDLADDAIAHDFGRQCSDVDKIQDWWRQNQNSFSCGAKYLLGKPVNIDRLSAVLAGETSLHNRRIAAMKLALTGAGVPLTNCAVRARVRNSRSP